MFIRSLVRKGRVGRNNRYVQGIGGVSRAELALTLCEHFDSPLETPCGHCSWCNNERAVTLPERTVRSVTPDVWGQATGLRMEHPNVMSHPVVLTRFLCGVTSPAISRAKLGSHPLFGKLSRVPFQEVLEQLQRMDD